MSWSQLVASLKHVYYHVHFLIKLQAAKRCWVVPMVMRIFFLAHCFAMATFWIVCTCITMPTPCHEDIMNTQGHPMLWMPLQVVHGQDGVGCIDEYDTTFEA